MHGIAAGLGPTRARLAGLPRRLAAAAYELLILLALSIAIGFLLLPFGAYDPRTAGAPSPAVPSGSTRIALLAAVCVGYGVYCLWFWTGNRTTLPMKTWRLTLRTATNEPVRWPTAMWRYVMCWIGPLCALGSALAIPQGAAVRWTLSLAALNFAWALVDPERQFLHDRIAGTRLFDTRPPAHGERI